MLKIITADDRLKEERGPKILIAGAPGIGKTTLLRTIDPSKTLFVDLEAGDLAVQDVQVDQVRPRTWTECRDIACYLGGPNPALAAESPYSQAHYDYVVKLYGDAAALDKYDIYFLDSVTTAARLCFTHCEQQPFATSAKTGNKDMLAVYGALGREMIGWLTQLQHARLKAVVLVCILENVKDEFGRPNWDLQIDGAKCGRELPGIVDQVITMALVKPTEDAELQRGFVCKTENEWKYPAKDRSGRLDMLEPPHLGKLLTKLTESARPAALSKVA